ncbi:RNA polymerase sigma factor [Asticcacaulis solisilvae]|uniref:RNA polymerase sigma factor n=1 Tax=Asticcacaulis solisilvae TaxID=1217274 RepID=UPI003FD755FA
MLKLRGDGGKKVPGADHDEVDLVGRVVGRDRRAFETLYRLYHPRLTAFLTRFIRRPDRVEEALNDTLMVVWNRADRYNGQSKVSTWVFGIAYRQGLKALSRFDEAVEDADAESRRSEDKTPEEHLGQRQTRIVLDHAMETLSADHRAVVDLAYFHEMGYREIAEIMDCPVDTVKTRMFHARRNLKAQLAGQLADWL